MAGGNAICAIFQAANAKVAKSKSASTRSGTISLDISTYDKKEIISEFEKADVTVSAALSVRKNRKEALGTHLPDPEKHGVAQEGLAKMHERLDATCLTQVNRDLTRALHDAVSSSDATASETIAITKLRPILKTTEVTKILSGELLGSEKLWIDSPWLMPGIQIQKMWAKLAYRFEGMTEMINGRFMDDLAELLNSATGDQRKRKAFYKIDAEFEKMCHSLLKNFTSLKSLMPFLRSSLRQTTIQPLNPDETRCPRLERKLA